MTKNSMSPAFPVTLFDGQQMYDDLNPDEITKREYFIAHALQGLLVNAGRNGITIRDCHTDAIEVADRLLNALENGNE